MRRSKLLFDSDGKPTQVFSNFLSDIGIPGNDLSSINNSLQARFFQKGPDGKPLERWELKEVEVSCPKERIITHLSNCGFIAATFPTLRDYNRAAWPGALLVRARARLYDLIQAWEGKTRWQELVVFGSKRALLPDKEGPEALCDNKALPLIRRDWPAIIWPRTELEMMRFLWDWSEMPREMRKVPVTFVDAPLKAPLEPGGQPVRPNTEDTILYWLETERPASGSMLVSCGAPYGMAIDEAFQMILVPRGDEIETFGHAAPEFPIETFMREVAGCVNRIKRSRLG